MQLSTRFMEREQVVAKLRPTDGSSKMLASCACHCSVPRPEAIQARLQMSICWRRAFDGARRISVFDVVGLELDLSEMLGCKVDLIEEGTLKPRVRRSVEAEVVRAF